ncbi:MAG: hypothetical protein ACTSW1_19860, partial [Candidatus Hodarchaeales archaeon]
MSQPWRICIKEYLFEISTGTSLIVLFYLVKIKSSTGIVSNELLLLIDIILALLLISYILIILLSVLKRFHKVSRQNKTKLGDIKIIIHGYFFILIITILMGYILFLDLTSILNFLGAWL